jgi:tetratricopeptide (TPR) repeat protein
MNRFLDFLRKRRRLLLGLVVLLAVGAGVIWWLRPVHRDPLLDTPQLALEALQAKSLYFNGRAKPWLIARRPDLLVPEDRDENSQRSRGFVQAVQNPNLFRQLDRRYHFDALLLVGDPSEYKALLDHLLDRKDWTLQYVDHTSVVFRRGEDGRRWELGDFAKIQARFAQDSKEEQAEVLAQTGVRLLATHEEQAGKTLLDEALHFDDRQPIVWNGLAAYYLGRAEWREAWASVESALRADHNFLPALATKTQLLYGMKRFSEAYDVSKDLIERVPDDPNILFYHAKVAHEAHAYQGEIAALEKLIAQADANEREVGGYQIYLGQAYAARGDAQKAVDAFMLSLDDPDLPDDQRSYARESIARIKKRVGIK